MDIIFLRGLRIETIIGVYDWEREIQQTIILDLEMACDTAKAAQSDAIEDTLDYKAVSKRVIGFVENSEFFLVETMAEQLAHLIRSEFGVPWVRLTLNKKGAIRGASDVGVIIERGDKFACGSAFRGATDRGNDAAPTPPEGGGLRTARQASHA